MRRSYFWAFTNDHILYSQDKAGDENWRVYSVDLTTGLTRDLTPLEGVQARVQAVSFRFPEEILIGLNDRDPQVHDIYRVNIATGERQIVQENDQGFIGFVTDNLYNIRFASRITSDGGSEVFKLTGDGGWESFMKIAMEDTLTTSPIALDKTGRVLYVVDSRDRNTSALPAINLDNGELTAKEAVSTTRKTRNPSRRGAKTPRPKTFRTKFGKVIVEPKLNCTYADALREALASLPDEHKRAA